MNDNNEFSSSAAQRHPRGDASRKPQISEGTSRWKAMKKLDFAAEARRVNLNFCKKSGVLQKVSVENLMQVMANANRGPPNVASLRTSKPSKS